MLFEITKSLLESEILAASKTLLISNLGALNVFSTTIGFNEVTYDIEFLYYFRIWLYIYTCSIHWLWFPYFWLVLNWALIKMAIKKWRKVHGMINIIVIKNCSIWQQRYWPLKLVCLEIKAWGTSFQYYWQPPIIRK